MNYSPTGLGLRATVAFSATAVLAIPDRGVELFEAITLGFTTAVGGGTIRDIILDVPVFRSIDLSYVWVGIATPFSPPSLSSPPDRGTISTQLVKQGWRSRLGDLSDIVAMAGTVAFAVTAVLAVTDRGIDLFGGAVLGIITAVGGGTVRDLILEVPVFWSADLSYIWVALGASVAAFVAHSLLARHHIHSLFLYVDGLGAALFAVQATGKVWDLDFGLPVAPVMLGVVTAIGGGLIRDVLAGRPTLLMSRELYAVPVLLGCLLFVVLLTYFPEQRFVGSIACIFLIFGLRAAAIHWKLTVPYWFTTKPTAE